MLGLLSCAAFFYLTHWLVCLVATPFTFHYFAVWLAYYAASECVEWYGLLHMPSWRRSRFARYIGRTLYRSRFSTDLEHTSSYSEIKTGPIMFILEPHGYASLHMVFGFAAHGGALPRDIADRTFVVAHWTCRLLPIIRNIFSAFGVIYSNRSHVERVLKRGYNIAVCASGITGKYMAMRNYEVLKDAENQYRYAYDTGSPYVYNDYGMDTRLRFADGSPLHNGCSIYCDMVVVQRSTKKLGCFKLAADYCATVYPVFSPCERNTFASSGHWLANLLPQPLANCFAMTLMPAFGDWLILQRCEPYEWYFGRPVHIDRRPGAKRPTPEQLATEFYNNLSHLGDCVLCPILYDFDRTLFKTDDRLYKIKI